MKHPLTSKERRGLVAVAAAALLCISSGFIVRNCGGTAPGVATPSPESSSVPSSSAAQEKPEDSVKKDSAKNWSHRKKKDRKTSKKKKKATSAPVRDPLSEPCD